MMVDFSNRIRALAQVAIALLVSMMFSCTQPQVSLPPIPSDDQSLSQDYVIGSEDILEVMVWKNPDLSRTVNVRPDGKISLPLIGDIQAAGLTTVQLQNQIVERLKTYYRETPQVSVIVQQVNSYAIYLLGEIRNPGRYVVKTGTTFLQAITLAGGFTEFASTNRILLRRMNLQDSEEMSLVVSYRDIISGKQKNIFLKAGDTIIVP